ncbi:MAG: thioredoxin family protein [Alphaproteobacteria bacterium]|nr:thioredoxin family protein [Alphaproteobacteria bacterium]
MILRKVYSFVIFTLLLFSFRSYSEVCFRTFSNEDIIFVSIDFDLKYGEHITSPYGKGKSISPKCNWQNAELLETYWQKDVELSNPDGQKSEYKGYLGKFSILYKIKINDIKQPILYDLFYVKCNENSCIPCDKTGELVLNNKLNPEEIDKYINTEPLSQNMLLILFFSLFGGIILNFMPCVFPIISIKIFSLLKSSSLSKTKIRKQSLAFSFGSIFTILLLGGIFLIIRSSFQNITWGFFMQSPICIFLLLIIFLFSALHFWNIYSFNLPIPKKIKYTSQNIYLTNFFSGSLAAITSSSCAGPFSGIALSTALLYNNLFQSIFIFMTIGIGLAFPFILISIFPNLIKHFPKPGNWLNIFKKLMGFAMLFSCLWPISILLSQLSHSQVIQLLSIIFAMTFILWLIKHSNIHYVKYSLALILVILVFSGIRSIENKDFKDCINWQEYSDEVFNNAQKDHKPIFLNFTASWCMNCQFNHRVFEDKDLINEFKKDKITAIKCDLSRNNAKLTELLKKYNTIAIPLYVYYSGNDSTFKILPSILTKDIVMKYIKGD